MERDTNLSSMRVPEPAAPDTNRHNTLEDEDEWGTFYSDQTEDEFLAEVAAPSPTLCRQCSRAESRQSRLERPRSRITTEEQDPSGKTVIRIFLEGRLLDEMLVISWLIFFSLLGTLARLGTEAVATYPQAPFPSTVLWANLGGSFFLGFLIEDRKSFEKVLSPAPLHRDSNKNEKEASSVSPRQTALPFYIGLSTGFCGSFTSFSTLIVDAFLALSNTLPSPSSSSPFHSAPPMSNHPRNDGFSFEAVLAVLIIQICISMASLQIGAQLALGLREVLPNLPIQVLNRVLNLVAIPIGTGSWLGAVFLVIWPPGGFVWRGQVIFPLVFAPIGCLARFYMSKYLNPMIPAFPLGTFAINIFGTCVAGMCFDLQRAKSPLAPSSAISCVLLQGIIQGFSGCATTVSTWVAELQGLKRRHAWIYGVLTIGVALLCQVAIMGPVRWTIGFRAAKCDIVPAQS